MAHQKRSCRLKTKLQLRGHGEGGNYDTPRKWRKARRRRKMAKASRRRNA